MFVDDETGEIYDYSAWSQVVRVEAYDAAGHRTLRNALLYDTVYGEKMYNEGGFNDARYSDGTIRGDILIYPTNDVNVLGDPITQVFSYGAQLQEGKNVVTVELSDEATGTATNVTFTVVRDTAAPEAPVIAQGGDGRVTLTAAEEHVTLYYSYDGTEWVLYTGPFAPTAAKVYAKAVDQAGNESAVSQLAVAVAASQPVKTGDAAPLAVYAALLLTAAAALTAMPVLRRRRVR